MTQRQEISKLVQEALTSFHVKEDFELKIESPEQREHGDYSTNAALFLAKKIKENPLKLAEKIKSGIKSDMFEKIEVLSPGFINFFISKEHTREHLKDILEKKEEFGCLSVGRGKKIQVEFISANPTGPLTIGNARGGPYGNTLADVFKKAGFEVEKAYYINDCGNQILALGHSVLKDNEAVYKGKYIDYLAERIREKEPYLAGKEAADIIVDEMIKKTTDKMGILYDEWFSEDEMQKKGMVDKAVAFLDKKGFLYKKEGAVWLKSSDLGDKRDRVLIKSNGQKTYLAGDIGYHRYKFEEKKFDRVINIWGADHYGDVPGLQAGVEALGYKGGLDVVLLQFVSLLEKGRVLRMSKRKGVYVLMSDLLDDISPDVVKFFFLQKSTSTHLNFDLTLAKEQSSKNPPICLCQDLQYFKKD